MNLKTLNYIHELLVKNVDAAKKDWEEAEENKHTFVLNKRENSLSDSIIAPTKDEEYCKLKDIVTYKFKIYQEAKTMLQTFEEEEW